MRRTLAIVVAFGLASCDAYRPPTPLGGTGASPDGRQAAGSPEDIGVVTRKSVPAYYRDLEHCRAVVAAAMGAPGPQDDMEALRRALKDHPQGKTVSLTYINGDLAIKRRDSVKRCLSQIGYIVRK